MKPIYELLISISLLLPYIDIRFLNSLFKYESMYFTIYPSMWVMLIVITTVTIKLFLKRYKAEKSIKKIFYITMFLLFIVMLYYFYNPTANNPWNNVLWFGLPLLYSFSIVIIVKNNDLNVYNILSTGGRLFIYYLFFIAFVNVKKYNISFFSRDVENRLISPGGGPVIIGYTIVIYMLLIVHLDKIKKVKFLNIKMYVLLFFSLLTGSRGSIIPSLVIIFLKNLKFNKTWIDVLRIYIFVLVLLMVKPVSLIGYYFPRIQQLTSGGRTQTFTNSFDIFFQEYGLFEKFFGHGVNNVFPYQDWYNRININNAYFDYNFFIFRGYALLVQPHNTFIYFLLELGLVGIFYYILIFIYLLIISKQSRIYSKFKYRTVLLIFLLNLLDSVFIVQPGSAGLWWVLMLLVVFGI